MTTFYADDSISRVIPGKTFYQFDVMTIRKKKNEKDFFWITSTTFTKNSKKLYPDHEREKS